MEHLKYFKKHLDGIDSALKSIDNNDMEKFISYFRKPNVNIFLTGVGKNGHVAAKAVSTLNSMGIKVFFINPVDAVHGDVGVVSENDVIIAISKSGNTEELINFLFHVNKRTKNISILHSNKNNKSLEFSEFDLYVEINDEADHLNKVPTVSIAVYTIVLQSISCVLAEENGLDLKSFVFNHPGGSIGKSLGNE
jgi:arabinose-5-phosphate isomerase